MAYLGKYIRQILTRKEPVIFPGMGSLVFTEEKGTREKDGKIHPPGPFIRFDSTHPKGDGKLAIEYASGEGMDPEEARQQVLELVDAIKFKLDKGETYTIDLVGTFSRDDDNRIHFAKDPNWVIDPELFGLTSLDLLELEKEESKETADSPEAEIEDPEPATRSAEPIKQQRAYRRPVKKWPIIWMVVGALIVVLFLILMIPSGDSVEFGKDGIVIRDLTPDNNLPGEDEEDWTKEIEKQAVQPTEREPELEERPVQETVVPVTQNNFFIIAGSFQSLPNANELMNQLKAGGFPAEIILTENRSYRVAVSSYATKEAALRDLDRIKIEAKLPNAWVLTR